MRLRGVLDIDLRRDLLVNRLAASPLIPSLVRHALLRRYGIALGPDTLVSPGCFFGSSDVRLGAGTFVNVGTFFDGSGPITVGSGCDIAMQVMLCTSDHELGDTTRRAARPTVGRPIAIGDGCWIGARAVVLPGVSIGAGCVIAAGAVVTRDCDPDGLYAGIPARRVRTLESPADRAGSVRAAAGEDDRDRREDDLEVPRD